VDRYQRQARFAPIGIAGQHKLSAARVLVVGCGGLGSNAAGLLARAGVGALRIVDRDVVELSNLQRQSLFSEADALGGVPKAIAAARRIAAVNSGVRVEPIIADLDSGNVLGFLDGIDLVIDGFDNFEGRYVLNDACVKRGLPWVYGACVGATAMAGLFVPHVTACFRCLHRELPAAGAAETCDTAGIIGPAAVFAASMQVAMALRFLVTGPPAEAVIVSADAWDLELSRIAFPRDPSCPSCGLGHFEFLSRAERTTTALCGRDAIAVRAMSAGSPNLPALAARLRGLGEVQCNEFLLRLAAPPYELTVFCDGRAIVKGTTDPALARSLVARWIGV
jgi:adenylyltransferase/sulfurtransferase